MDKCYGASDVELFTSLHVIWYTVFLRRHKLVLEMEQLALVHGIECSVVWLKSPCLSV